MALKGFDKPQVLVVSKTLICPGDPSWVPPSANPVGLGNICLASYALNAAALGEWGYGENFPVSYPPGPTPEPLPKNSTYRAVLSSSFPDGTSNTLVSMDRFALIGSSTPNWINNCWQPLDAAGNDAPVLYDFYDHLELTPQIGVLPQSADPRRASSAHLSVCMVGLADGSVRGVTREVSPTTWRYALLPADGMVLGSDW